MNTDPNDWLEYTAGRTNGVKAVLLVLAATHPDPGALLVELEKVEQSALAHTEGHALREIYLDGMREVIDSVRNILILRVMDASDRSKP